MSTNFAVPVNNASTTVGAATAGSGTFPQTLTLASGGGSKFPALTGSQYYRITICQVAYAYSPTATTSNYTIYKADTVSGDTLQLRSVLEGGTDRVYNIGDVVEVRVTAGTLSDIQGAVNTLETSGGGGGVTIGNAVSGGTNNKLLYVDGTTKVADTGPGWDGTTLQFSGTNVIQTSGATLQVGNTGATFPTNILLDSVAIRMVGTGADVVDVVWQPSSGGAHGAAFRWEHRNVAFAYSSNSSGEFQLLAQPTSGGPTTSDCPFIIGKAAVIIGPPTSPSSYNNTGTILSVGGIPVSSTAKINVLANNTTDVGILVRGVSSQTGDLHQWQSSGGTTLSSVDANGYHRMVTGSGAPSSTPSDGALYVDTTNNKLYARTGGSWKSVTLA